jgi:heme-binding protein
MLLSGRTLRRATNGLIAGAATSGALLFGGAALATAQPTPPPPPPVPGCTAADLAHTSAGVAAATGDYLDGHPDVNNFFTGLRGLPDNEIPNDVQNYMTANPQAKSDLTAIRQPLTDLRNRCQ